jgi:hypothetical protein
MARLSRAAPMPTYRRVIVYMAVNPQIVKPDPDPTLLTTEALRREILNLKELIEGRIGANDKAIELVQASTNKFRDDHVKLIEDAGDALHSLILVEIEKLAQVTSVKFDSIATQFTERDKRTEQLSLADKTAIAAALQAQKEAAGATNESNSVALAKMENNFTKLIDQGQTLLQSVQKNMDDKISDLKSRIDSGEGQNKGKTEGIGMVGAIIIGSAFVVSAIVGVVGFILGVSHSVGTH